jgi:hypothetical protein
VGDGGNASIFVTANDFERIIDTASGGTVDFNLTSVRGATSATLPTAAAKAFSNAELNLQIALPEGTITFGQTALTNICQNTSSDNLTITMKTAEPESLTQAQWVAVGSNPVFELAVFDGTRNISDFGGNVEVRLPYTLRPGENPYTVVVYYVNAAGDLRVMKDAHYDAGIGQVIFTTRHFSKFMITSNPVWFNDIYGHWANVPITQSGARGLAIGYLDGLFMPNASITKAEFIQMLYDVLDLRFTNTAGAAVYNDVTSDMWFYTAIGAARNAGLLSGIVYGDGSFKPNEPITRLEMADVLSKIALNFRVRPVNDFRAVSFTDFNAIFPGSVRAVELAVNVGFLNENGMGDGSFRPGGFTTRAQAATIQIMVLRALYRLD